MIAAPPATGKQVLNHAPYRRDKFDVPAALGGLEQLSCDDQLRLPPGLSIQQLGELVPDPLGRGRRQQTVRQEHRRIVGPCPSQSRITGVYRVMLDGCRSACAFAHRVIRGAGRPV
ncbi:hypothetical protein ACFVZD_45605 [Streptomyces sp. NPDC058287]|uniref:hypothetical protein n=1 Tax=unclassified Streptomyces TaxID=2593676 RepID=UPI0036E43C1D